MENNEVPAIRFPGYSEKWKKSALSELVTPIIREVPKPNKPYERISIRSHAKGTFHQKVEDPKTVAMEKLYVVKENDLIVNITFAWEHAIAIAGKKDNGLLVSHRFPTFVIDKSDINFIRYSVIQEKFRRKMELISPGGAGRNRVLNKKDFINLKINVPNQIEEQVDIGNFFNQLDEVIVLLQQELSTLKQTKQGFLQKMLPKEGKSIPEFRFPGFTEDWEQIKLGDITKKIGSGKTPKGGSSVYTQSGIPFLRSQNINNNLVDFSGVVYIPEIVDEEMANSRVQKNDILLNITGASIGRSAVYESSKVANVNQHVCIIRPNSEIDSHFVQLNITATNGRKQIEINQAGGGREGLNFQQISRMSFSYPSNKGEQTKIGDFFKQLDDTIALQQQELDALLETKKAFLHKMFI